MADREVGARSQAVGAEDELKSDVGGVGAVGLVNFGDVFGVGEGDVDALAAVLVSSTSMDGGDSIWNLRCTTRRHAAPSRSLGWWRFARSRR